MKAESSQRFTVVPGQWLAMEAWLCGCPDPPHCSPIRVLAIRPHREGRGELTLRFFHAAYPEGVQEKEYGLRVLHRGREALTLLRLDESEMEMTLTLFPLHRGWLERYFPDFLRHDDEAEMEAVLERRFGFATTTP